MAGPIHGLALRDMRVPRRRAHPSGLLAKIWGAAPATSTRPVRQAAGPLAAVSPDRISAADRPVRRSWKTLWEEDKRQQMRIVAMRMRSPRPIPAARVARGGHAREQAGQGGQIHPPETDAEPAASQIEEAQVELTAGLRSGRERVLIVARLWFPPQRQARRAASLAPRPDPVLRSWPSDRRGAGGLSSRHQANPSGAQLRLPRARKAKPRLDAAVAVEGGRSGAAIKPGHAAASLLLERVSDPSRQTRMPPEGKPLTPAQIAALESLDRAGRKAPGRKARSRSPQALGLPARHRPDCPVQAPNRRPIRLTPSCRRVGETRPQPIHETDKATLLRRVYLDLIGLPPTPEQLHAFLADTAPDAYEKVVEELLASPAIRRAVGPALDGCLALLRLVRPPRRCRTCCNSYGQVWRWRDWIVRSLNDDRGYDAMIRVMLAADELAPTNDDGPGRHRLPRPELLPLELQQLDARQRRAHRQGVPRPDAQLLPLPRPQVRSDHPRGVLPLPRHLRADRDAARPLAGRARPRRLPEVQLRRAPTSRSPAGMVRVFDEKPDAKTFFYTGGDERNIVKDRPPVPPGVPAALGGTFAGRAGEPARRVVVSRAESFVRPEETEKREDAIASRPCKARRTADAGAAKGPPIRAGRGAKYLARAIATWRRSGSANRWPTMSSTSATPGDTRRRCRRPRAAPSASHAHRLAARRWSLRPRSRSAAARNGRNAKYAPLRRSRWPKRRRSSRPLARPLDAPSDHVHAAVADLPQDQQRPADRARRKWITEPDNPLTARVAVNHIWAGHFGRPLVETTNNFGRSGKPPTPPRTARLARGRTDGDRGGRRSRCTGSS